MVAARISASVARVVRDLVASVTRTGGIAACRPPAATHRPSPRPTCIDPLEPRYLLSAALDLIGVTALRADPNFAGIDGSGVTVAVIDTGVDFDHPLLATSRVGARDFVRNNNEAEPTDEHGTHVAGIVGARDLDIGVAPAVGIAGLQVFTPTQSGSVLAFDSDTEAALQWVLDNRVALNIVAVNMSLGSGNFTSAGGASNSILFDDVRRLEQAGVTVVAAAGNSYADLETPGSASPGVFSTIDVGAVYETNEGRVSGGGGTDFTTAADRVTFFSQRPNTSNEVFAPGAFIRSTVPGGGFAELAGTSMASPMVAGVVALMQDAALTFGGRLLTPDEVRDIIQDTSDVIVDGDDENTSVDTTGGSFRRVNAFRAVSFVRDTFVTGGAGGGSSADPNGTLGGAVAGPTLTGGAAGGFTGTVGFDGSTDTGANDVDIFSFTVATPGTVTVTLDGGVALQPHLRLFNSGGTQIAFNSPSGPGTASITLPLAAGTYFAGVSGAPNSAYNPNLADSGVAGATGDYTLDFSSDASDADGILVAAVPINLTSGDVPQALNVSIGFDDGRLVGAADVDIVQITVPDDGFLLIDTDTLTTPVADTFVRVFNANGTEIFTSDDDLATGLNGEAVEFDDGGGLVSDANFNPAGHTTDSFISAAVTKGDVYFIAVCNFENRNFDPNSMAGRVTTGDTGEYSLFVSLRNRDFNGAIPQAVNTSVLPTVQGPGTIGSDGTPNGLVTVGDRDVDFIKINSPDAGILEVDVDSFQNAPGINNPVDTVLRLFDADGNLLATSDDDESSLDPVLRFEIDAGTDYYAAIAGFGNDTFDPFILGSGGTGDTGNYLFNASVLPLSMEVVLSNDNASGGEVAALALNQTANGNIGEDNGFVRGDTDVDIFTFAPSFTGEFTFTAGPSDDFGCDTFLRLFNADGSQIAADDNGQGGTGGSKIVANLVAGTSYLVGVNGASPNAAAYDPITGAGAASGSTGGYVLEVAAGARTITFGGRTKAIYTDTDGSRVIVSLKGPGSAMVLFATEDDVDAMVIVLEGTTAASSVSVKGDTTVGSVSATGALKSFAARTLDLSGDFSAGGSVRTLTIRTIANSNMTIGGGEALTLKAGGIFDTNLTAAGGIKSLKTGTWADNGGADDTITSPLVSSISAPGDFDANVNADFVGNVKVGGELTGAIRSTGNITSVSAASVNGATVYAGVAAGLTDLPAAGQFANTLAEIRSFTVKGKFTGAFTNSRVAAPTIRKASLGNVLTSNATTLGVAADSVFSISGIFDGSEKFKLKNLFDVGQSVTRTNFVISIV